MKTLIYDCEIVRCIPDKSGLQPDLEYCQGWHDHAGMGISLIGTWASWIDEIKLYPESAFDQFQAKANEAELIVGFNSLSFDDKLCAANGLQVETDYDLLSEVWAAAGMPRRYTYGQTRAGYKLENLAQANLGRGKSGSGELAPVLWQTSRQWQVATYLTDDILITKKIWEKRSHLVDPTTGEILTLREPEQPITPFVELDSTGLKE